VIYLGQATPLEDVIKAAAIHAPDFLFSTYTSPMPQIDLEVHLNQLKKHFPDKVMYVSGLQLNDATNSLSGQIKHIKDPMGFKQELIDLLR
jgi:MerR family transcriptional regulator, light-induced transcriptional regulator